MLKINSGWTAFVVVAGIGAVVFAGLKGLDPMKLSGLSAVFIGLAGALEKALTTKAGDA